MTDQNLNIAIRKVALNSAFRMTDATEISKSLNPELLHTIIDIAILEEGVSFTTDIAKTFFVKCVLKILKNEYYQLFKCFYTNINDRIFI
jgi:hypothetical protein